MAEVEEKRDLVDEHEDMDDLFGEENESGNEIDSGKGSGDGGIGEEGDGNDDLGLNIDDGDEEVEEEEEKEEEIKEADLTLERHPRSHTPMGGDAFSFPLPRFLFVEPTPFTPNLFEQQLKEFIASNQINSDSESTLRSSIQFKKLQLTNTIRWRYAKTKNNDLYKQSNANIIEWEDGSKSLKIGNEYFDIKTNQNDDNILAFKNGETLMPLVDLNKSIQILPPSMKSRAHQILATTLAKNMKMKKSKRINTIVTNEDPELKAREVTRAQKEIEKARRRQEQKLQLQQEQSERRSNSRFRDSAAPHGDDEIDDMDIEGGGYDDYDDEDDEDGDYAARGRGNGDGSGAKRSRSDGFIVDDDDEVSELDDDELDKAAERLKRVKREGAAKYKRMEQDDPDNDAGDEDDDDDDDGSVVRKKRKIVMEEDDDEE